MFSCDTLGMSLIDAVQQLSAHNPRFGEGTLHSLSRWFLFPPIKDATAASPCFSNYNVVWSQSNLVQTYGTEIGDSQN